MDFLVCCMLKGEHGHEGPSGSQGQAGPPGKDSIYVLNMAIHPYMTPASIRHTYLKAKRHVHVSSSLCGCSFIILYRVSLKVPVGLKARQDHQVKTLYMF